MTTIDVYIEAFRVAAIATTTAAGPMDIERCRRNEGLRRAELIQAIADLPSEPATTGVPWRIQRKGATAAAVVKGEFVIPVLKAIRAVDEASLEDYSVLFVMDAV